MGFTVAMVITMPHGLENEIRAVPAATPVNTPEGVIVATEGEVLIHEPGEVFVRVMLLPVQMGTLPAMGLTSGTTVTTT